MKKILFIGCHCDDIELGCGGTINKYRDQCIINCLVLSRKTSSGIDISEISSKALTSMGAHNITFCDFKPSFFHYDRQQIWECLDQRKDYDAVYTQIGDEHQDHTTLYNESLRVFISSTLYAYRASSRSCPYFEPNYFEVLKKKHVKSKLKGLELYLDVYSNKNYLHKRSVSAQMKVDGIKINEKYAEAFKILREIR